MHGKDTPMNAERKPKCCVSREECRAMQEIHARLSALKELEPVLPPEKMLQEKFQRDLHQTQAEFQSWWNRMIQKYGWKCTPNAPFRLDFQTCEVTSEPYSEG